MLILTGGAGFIGSVLLKALNKHGITDILVIDSLKRSEKWKNLNGKIFSDYLDKNQFLRLLEDKGIPENTSHIIHLGACSSTMEGDLDYLMLNNYRFSKLLAMESKEKNIPFIYASSAATYGDGTLGFEDDEASLKNLMPLNGYGFSKQIFDNWILQEKFSNQVVGLKFFNVFGPNEYHKDDMRSLVEKAYHQITESGYLKLFKSDKPDFKDGEQKRDFVYVKDVARILIWFLENANVSGIFNIGSGEANTWLTLANSIFKSLNKEPKIEFIDLPDNLKGKYQYFTQAPIKKLRKVGCDIQFTKLPDAIDDYVKNYLTKENKFL